MSSQPDYYAILEVSEHASPEVITSAYRSLARKFHPDANPSPEADARMKAINVAYAVLGDHNKRAAYDRQRAAAKQPPLRTPASAPPPPAQAAQPVMQAHAAPPPLEPELTPLQRIGAVLTSPAAGIFIIAFIIAYVATTFIVGALGLWWTEEGMVLLAVIVALIATVALRREWLS